MAIVAGPKQSSRAFSVA